MKSVSLVGGDIDSDTYLEVEQNGNSQVIACDEPLVIGAATSTGATRKLILQPLGESVTYDQPVEITVKHMNASSTLASSKVVLTVLGKAQPRPVATSTPNTTSRPTTPSTPVAPNPTYTASPARLNATMGSVTVDANSRATVTFYVTNEGGRNSGAWQFSAVLPRRGQTVYQSPLQPSIPPQGRSVMYLTFDSAQAGDIVINVGNDQATATLR